MRIQVAVGLLLVIVGIASLVFGGFSYTTTREEVRVGPVGITAQEKKTFRIPPAVGGLLFAGGIVLLIASGRRR